MIPIQGFTHGTDYSEYGDSDLSIQDGKLSGKRVFRLFNYQRKYNFLVALCGGMQFNGSQQIRIIPHRFDWNVDIYCKSASVKGIGVASRTSEGHQHFSGGAEVTVNYASLDYNPQQDNSQEDNQQPAPGPYITESGSTSAQAITRVKKDKDGNAAWKWVTDDEDLEDETAPDIVAREVRKQYVLTRHRVAIYPRDEINALVGKVNDSLFPPKSSAGGFPTATLLFDGDDFSRETLSDGSTNAWTINLKFTYNPNGWNKLFRPSTGEYEQVYRSAGDGASGIYVTGDFTELLGNVS